MLNKFKRSSHLPQSFKPLTILQSGHPFRVGAPPAKHHSCWATSWMAWDQWGKPSWVNGCLAESQEKALIQIIQNERSLSSRLSVLLCQQVCHEGSTRSSSDDSHIYLPQISHSAQVRLKGLSFAKCLIFFKDLCCGKERILPDCRRPSRSLLEEFWATIVLKKGHNQISI